MVLFFSCKSDSRIANVRLSVCLSVRLSVCQSQKPLSLSELLLSTIKPINQRAIDHQAYRPLSLSTIYQLSDLLSRLLSHFGLLIDHNIHSLASDTYCPFQHVLWNIFNSKDWSFLYLGTCKVCQQKIFIGDYLIGVRINNEDHLWDCWWVKE